MDVSPNVLRRDTVMLIQQIEELIKAVQVEAADRHISPSQLRDANDNWVMPSLLLAKAQAYHTLVLLTQKQ